MQSATSANVEPASLAKAGAARKKASRSRWASTGTQHTSRPSSTADFQKVPFEVPDHAVVRPVRAFGPLVAVSPAMHEVFDLLDRFARTSVTLTLLGETGTGKDVVAHALHTESERANGPFVVFDCGAVAANL